MLRQSTHNLLRGHNIRLSVGDRSVLSVQPLFSQCIFKSNRLFRQFDSSPVSVFPNFKEPSPFFFVPTARELIVSLFYRYRSKGSRSTLVFSFSMFFLYFSIKTISYVRCTVRLAYVERSPSDLPDVALAIAEPRRYRCIPALLSVGPSRRGAAFNTVPPS